MNVVYEIGGVGTGVCVWKDLLFGWQYGSLEGLYCGIDDYNPRQADVIINRLPQHLQAEVRTWYIRRREAKTVMVKKTRAKQLEQRTKDKAQALATERAMEEYRRVANPSNDELRKNAKEYMEHACSDFRVLLQNIIDNSDPRSYLKELYESEDNKYPRGWIADLYPGLQKPFV
jgi:hypothetical protein